MFVAWLIQSKLKRPFRLCAWCLPQGLSPFLLLVIPLATRGSFGQFNDNRWSLGLASAPWASRDSAGTVVFKGKMWILGGFLDYFPADASGLNEVYFRTNDVWFSENGLDWMLATAQASWPARNLPASVAFKEKMWIMGGFDGTNSLNDV